ncbi:MAG TPA: hypothetical protein DC000_11835 [Clostridiales bacterium]|nr:hypothetical protein [Clostridiales bacterium]
MNKKRIACLLLLILFIVVGGNAPKTITKIGYISNISKENMQFDFDEIEWVRKNDIKRVEDLKLNKDTDFPNGFYIYNLTIDNITYKLSKDAIFEFLDENENFSIKNSTYDEFIAHHNQFFNEFIKPLLEDENIKDINFFTPYWIEIKNDIVISIKQQYVP